jgi:Domain of unknown function (DUF4349)
MTNKIAALWLERKNWIRNAWFVMAGLAAIYYGAIWPRQAFQGIAESRSSALAAFENRRHEHWFQANSELPTEEHPAEGVIGGVPGGVATFQKGSARSENAEDRKIVRTSSIAIVVGKPTETALKIQQLAESTGGFLVDWDANGSHDATCASLVIRVPVAAYDATRISILQLAQRVENERVRAEDVTRQYVDDAARLRNLRAQETQYLAILKMARTVKDTREVSEKLNQVRGDIEQQQSEFNNLSKQVDLVAISVSLRKETEAQVFGLPWRPGYEIRFAARQGLEGLLDYSTSVISFLFYLPAIALWRATILLGTFLGWRILRRVVKVLFVNSRMPAVSS